MADKPTDVLRTRARSLASLVATAGGGLGVALVLGSTAPIGSAAKIVGLIATSSLLIGAATLAVASSVQPVQKAQDPTNARKLLFWEVPYTPDKLGILEERVTYRIVALSRTGVIATLLAIPTLIAALILSMEPTFGSTSVLVAPRKSGIIIAGCGELKTAFYATVKNAELTDGQTYLTLGVPLTACGSAKHTRVRALLARDDISISQPETR